LKAENIGTSNEPFRIKVDLEKSWKQEISSSQQQKSSLHIQIVQSVITPIPITLTPTGTPNACSEEKKPTGSRREQYFASWDTCDHEESDGSCRLCF
jgi:hypothetical protein